MLLGLALPDILRAPASITPPELLGLAVLVCAAVIVTRFAVGVPLGVPAELAAAADRGPQPATRLAAHVPRRLVGPPRRGVARGGPRAAARLPGRNLILLLTFAVILATLVGQGLTLPIVVRWVGWDGLDGEADEVAFARATMYQVGLGSVRLARARWPNHEPLLDRLESGLEDRERHLATEDPDETVERTREHEEHEEIQLSVINAQRGTVIALRDAGEINDATLRTLERELDLEELRMEA